MLYQLLRMITFLLLISNIPSAHAANTPADFVFANGRIYTVNLEQPWAEAVVIKGDKLIYVGDTSVAQSFVGEGTEYRDLGGKMMMPGFIEGHFHTTIGATFGQGLWLAHLDTKEEVLDAVRKYVKAHPEKEIIMGFGWKSFTFSKEGPKKEWLDEITSERPIYLFEITAHAAWVNSKALNIAGVTKDTPDPQPGFSVYTRDKDGEPTGRLLEPPAEFHVFSALQDLSPKYVQKGLEEWMPKFSASGITTAIDQGYIFQGLATEQIKGYGVLKALENSGKLSTRVYTSYYANNPKLDNIAEYNYLKENSPDTRLIKHRILKINQDGDTISHSCKLYEPYLDTGEYGSSIFTQDQLTDLVTRAAAENINIHTHAMGDASVGMLLTAVEAAQKAHPESTTRYSLAHVYLISPNDFSRIKDTGLIPTFAGSFMSADPSNTDTRTNLIGEARDSHWFPFGSLEKMGIQNAMGSDFPAAGAISTYKMMDQIQYAMTRQFLSGNGEVFPLESEQVTLDVVLKSGTINSARIIGEEEELGSIEVGKKADLIILDQNLFEIETSKIHETNILLTMVDGRVVHDAFFGIGDIETGLKMLGLVSEESEDFNLTPEELSKYIPANTDYQEHRNSCNIGTEFYEAQKAKAKNNR